MATISEFLKNNGLLHDAVKKVGDYDFFNKVVGFDDDANNVASGEATILFSGPPVYAKGQALDGGIANYLVPIGAVQGVQDSETPAITPFPELGSRLKRYAVGMAQYQLNISKVLTYYDNLRHALYAWIAKLPEDKRPTEFIFAPGEEAGSAGHAHFNSSESDLYRAPFGLLLATITAGGNLISREYYEKCYIANAGKSVQAGQAIIQEQVAITVTRKVPANNLVLAAALAKDAFAITGGNDSILA